LLKLPFENREHFGHSLLEILTLKPAVHSGFDSLTIKLCEQCRVQSDRAGFPSLISLHFEARSFPICTEHGVSTGFSDINLHTLPKQKGLPKDILVGLIAATGLKRYQALLISENPANLE
jgi:hypothetical protein